MNRLTGRMGAAALGLMVLLAFAQVADAQRGEGRRGRGGRGMGVPTAILVTADEVQTALKLSDEQKDKMEEISDELRDKSREVFQGGGGFGELRTLNQDASAKVAEALDDEQDKRLMGILIQVNGPNAVYEPAVAKELSITDEQQTKLADVREANMQTMGDAFREMRDQDLSREEMRDKFNDLRADADKTLLAELTPEQQSQLESLKGEPVEIDMSQFRGFGGRGGRGDRERRGDRDRDQDSEESTADDSTSTDNN